MSTIWPDAQTRIQHRMGSPESSSTLSKMSTVFQKVTANQPYMLASGALKTTFSAPPTLGGFLVDFATQPLPEHQPHFRPTSDQANLPGYWFSRNVTQQSNLAQWEVSNDSYDVLLIYFHGGAFLVGHALMYSTFMTNLVLHPGLRIRILTMEYELPTKNRPETQYPYQHRTLFSAYVHLLTMGVPPEKVVIGGDSSGGFNTLKAFEHIVDENVPNPGGILLNSPLLDLWLPVDKQDELAHLGPGNSLETNRRKDYVGPKFLKNGLNAYQAPVSSAPVRRGAKWYAENLPATFLCYGTAEVLLDYIRGFKEEMEKRGMDLMVFVGENESHVFNVLEQKYSRDKAVWRGANEALVKWLRRFGKDEY